MDQSPDDAVKLQDSLAEVIAKALLIRDSRNILLTSEEAALTLAISERRLWDLTHSGEIPCVRVGELVRYRPQALERWAFEKETRGPGERTKRQKGRSAVKRSELPAAAQ